MNGLLQDFHAEGAEPPGEVAADEGIPEVVFECPCNLRDIPCYECSLGLPSLLKPIRVRSQNNSPCSTFAHGDLASTMGKPQKRLFPPCSNFKHTYSNGFGVGVGDVFSPGFRVGHVHVLSGEEREEEGRPSSQNQERKATPAPAPKSKAQTTPTPAPVVTETKKKRGYAPDGTKYPDEFDSDSWSNPDRQVWRIAHGGTPGTWKEGKGGETKCDVEWTDGDEKNLYARLENPDSL